MPSAFGIIVKIQPKLAIYLSIVLTVVCLSVVVFQAISLSSITDPVELADAKGFVWFWTFLGSVVGVFGVLSWWIYRTDSNTKSE